MSERRFGYCPKCNRAGVCSWDCQSQDGSSGAEPNVIEGRPGLPSCDSGLEALKKYIEFRPGVVPLEMYERALHMVDELTKQHGKTLASIGETLGKTAKERDDLRAKLVSAEERIWEEAHALIDKHCDEKVALRRKLSTAEQDRDAALANWDLWSEKLKAEIKHSDELEAKLAEQNLHIDGLNYEIHDLQTKLAEKGEELDTLKRGYLDLDAKAERLRETVRKREQESLESMAEADELRAKLAESEKQLQWTEAQLEEEQKESQELEAKLDVAQRQIDELIPRAKAADVFDSRIVELEEKLAEAEKTKDDAVRLMGRAQLLREQSWKRAEAAEARVRELETQLQTMVAAYDRRIDVITGKP